MRARKKIRVTVSLSEDLVRRLDEEARSVRSSRSSVLEEWLRETSHRQSYERLEAETSAYYEALSDAELADSRAWARASTRSFMKRER